MAVPKLDIKLEETYNSYYIGFSDIGEYPTAWNVTNATAEVTPPGFPKIAVTFTPKAVNIYKSSQLGITCDEDDDCVPLPDGIYTIKYSIHPNSVYFIEKSFMRVNNIRCEYGQAYLKVDFSCNCDPQQKHKDKRALHDIAVLIDGAVAESNNCNVERAYEYYNKAKQLLRNFHKSGCQCD